jgi:hypothetical protein
MMAGVMAVSTLPANAAVTTTRHGHAHSHGHARTHTNARVRTRIRDRSYLIYDSITPSAIPSHHVVATYVNGNYAVSRSAVARRGPVLWIDINGSVPSASVLDVEPGNATPATAASWAWRKLHADPDARAIIYTMRSEWWATKVAVDGLPSWMRSHVRWWIADPTGVPHVVPGSSATQWYWGSSYDISTATSGF